MAKPLQPLCFISQAQWPAFSASAAQPASSSQARLPGDALNRTKLSWNRWNRQADRSSSAGFSQSRFHGWASQIA
jgi:hypothetical protein